MNSPEIRSASDLHIFIDTAWSWLEIQPAIATLLDSLDVNQFGTRFTLYNANDAISIIVNTTTSLSDLYSFWNQTSHQITAGLNLAAIIKQIRSIGIELLNEEHNNSQAGGRSYVALVVPQLSSVNEADSNYVAEQLVLLRETQPDLTLLFWAGGAPGRFARFVTDQRRDVFQLQYGSTGVDSSQQIYSFSLPVIQRIKSSNAN